MNELICESPALYERWIERSGLVLEWKILLDRIKHAADHGDLVRVQRAFATHAKAFAELQTFVAGVKRSIDAQRPAVGTR